MQSRVLEKCGNTIEHFIIAVFWLATAYLVARGSFTWDGGCTVYDRANHFIAGMLMLVLACCLLFGILRFYDWIKAKGTLMQSKVAVTIAVLAIVLQILFVQNVQVLIRYDSLKVLDEALGIFSQGGILPHDLNGYFARYSNNYAMTIMTHLVLKVWLKFGIIAPDFSDAVLKLQYLNIFFVDAALAGVFVFLERFFSRAKAVTFLGFMLLNPMTYVWLPFYYTNTVSMAFMIWGFLCMLYGTIYYERCNDLEGSEMYRKHVIYMVCCYALSAGFFYVGFKLRATVMIGFIATVIVMSLIIIERARIRTNRSDVVRAIRGVKTGFKSRIKGEAESIIPVSIDEMNILEHEDKDGHNILLCKHTPKLTMIAAVSFLTVFLVTSFVYNKVEKHYVLFDPTDSAFPVTHWVAMGLSYYGDGSFTPADEEYTISFATAAEKKAATKALIRARASELGVTGVGKLYLKKLHNTFSDGTGGYYSELGMSRSYSALWEGVYGTHRDFVLLWTQVFYLATLLSGILVGYLLIKKQISFLALWMPLTLLGHYLFQMMWESGTVYSIGTLFIAGCMVALSCKVSDVIPTSKHKLTTLLCPAVATVAILIGIIGMCMTKYDYIDVSVNQFLFEAVNYPALTEDREIMQTFTTERTFSNIGIEVFNETGGANDSVYQVALFDGEGNLLETNELVAKKVSQYGFYQMEFHNVEGVTNYQLRIRKEYGQHDLAFLYYDTGHYDVYPDGKMSGTVLGDNADLTFVVFDRR